MQSVSVRVGTNEAQSLPLGALVVVTVSGLLTGMNEEGENTMRLEVEGEPEVRPGSLDDAMRISIGRFSNAKPPADHPSGQRELHAP